MMFAVDAKGCLTDWSKDFAVVTEFHRHEVIGRRFLDFITFPFCKPVNEWMQRAKEGGTHEALPIPFYTKPGERVDIVLKAAAKNLESEDYVVECALAQANEDSLESQGGKDDSSPPVVVSVNKEWQVTGWNDAAEEWTMFLRCEAVGRDLLDFITFPHRDKVRQMLQQASCSRRAQSIQIPFYTKTAEKLDIQLSARIVADDVVVEGQLLQSDCQESPRNMRVKTAATVWQCPTTGSLQSLGGATSSGTPTMDAITEVARESDESVPAQ
eukprot:TRINITY_DN20331_c0_g2_i1.p1 TRINITY_DN20331_c0_g2~~TRINITY_DN20331_c0_g2_i1.p1  ORF type:complete len:270 (+),score=34.46 TRINITY_DN20331_c0_g2_i1:55-864(+)